MLFNDSDRARITDAVAEAESRTAGEIVVIVSAEAHRYAATCLSAAALLALAVPLVRLWLPFGDWDESLSALQSVEALIAFQAIVFGLVLALSWYSGLGRVFTPAGLRRDRVHRAALTQFKARGLEATTGRTGVLIFIDEPEHIAEIIADTGIFAKVPPDHWSATITALTDGIRAGTPTAGVIAAVALAGEVLAEHFPPLPDDVNELPDGLIEI
ncbi:MAG: TPM domain-containing protein [Sandarakinorhabdus sp.]|nr:TPM domain-containing protein [Sandarakinorhabdus sp.]